MHSLLCVVLLLHTATLVRSQSSQTVHCEYGFASGKFQCYLPAVNITTAALPLKVTGEHCSGKSKVDVQALTTPYRSNGSVTISVIHPQFFDEFPNLDEIWIQHAGLKTLEFRRCGNLRKIVVSFGNPVKTVPSGTFENCKRLTHLDLSRNHIEELSEGSFRGLSSLEHLDLVANVKIDIFNDSLVDCVNLRELKIGPNASIATGAFRKLRNLEILELRVENDGFDYFERLLDGLVNLTVIDLSWNNLSTVNFPFFTRFKRLEKLYVFNNEITDIQDGAFIGLNNLTQLLLDFNLITTLNGETFKGLTDLKLLIISGNNISDLSALPFTPLTSLNELFASYNPIELLPVQVFASNENLTRIMLNNCRITTIQPGVFHSLLSLKNLDLSQNELTTLSSGTFVNLPNLDYINFSFNRIEQLSSDAFLDVGNLTSLYIESNKLMAIETNFFSNFPYIHIFDGEANVCMDESVSNTHYTELWRGVFDACFENWTTTMAAETTTVAATDDSPEDRRSAVKLKRLILCVVVFAVIAKIFILIFFKLRK